MSERRRTPSGRPPIVRLPSNDGARTSGPTSANTESDHTPQASATGSQRPPLRWRQSERSKRFQYSTDDDEAEVERDLEREYYEGYTDGLKDRLRRVSKSPKIHPSNAFEDQEEEVELPPAASDGDEHELRHRRSELIEDLLDDDNEGGNEDDAAYELARDMDDNESTTSVETFTLRERQDAINTTHPFGIRIWKPAVYKKIRSVQRLADDDVHSTPGKAVTWSVLLGNLVWSVFFGTILMLACLFASLFMSLIPTDSARRYGKTFRHLGLYLWFPFGKFVEMVQQDGYILEDSGEGRSLAEYERWQAGDVEEGRLFFEPRSTPRSNTDTFSSEDYPSSGDNVEVRRKRRFFGRGQWTVGRVLFYIWFYFLVAPLLYITSAICWLGVFSIPMAKVTAILASQLRRHPLALKFKPASSYGHLSASESSSIILCTYRAFGISYYKYTIDGTNIFFINLMLPVLFVIFDWYVLAKYFTGFWTSSAFVFTLSLASVIPLAYFIGQAVASISAQSSMGMGAAINAFFSTIVEVFLYAVALRQGKGDLVEGSIIGSVLAGVLLLPGLSMCAGAVKRKTQRYNPKSAGVSSTMLIFAVIGAFAPTIFYQIYGTYELRCAPCNGAVDNSCQRCQMYQVPLENDALYSSMIQPFSNMCAILLFVAYVIGLWFTLRTHAAMIWTIPTSSELGPTHVPVTIGQTAPAVSSSANHNPGGAVREHVVISTIEQPSSLNTSQLQTPVDERHNRKHVTIELPKEEHVESGGHDAPNWSRTKSTIILLGATWLYAIIAEILVDTVDVVLQNVAIEEKLVGITIFALVPNTTEFLNAISFAVHGNIALSMEIGSAYALQVCLLQIPALVLYSTWALPGLTGAIHDYMFTLVFPRWDLCMVIFCVFLFSYIYAEGKSNYFKGSILILAYLVVMLGFFFANEEELDAGMTATTMIIQGAF